MPHDSGLHCLDFKEQEEAGVALVTMIQDNFEGFTKKQVECTIKACYF